LESKFFPGIEKILRFLDVIPTCDSSRMPHQCPQNADAGAAPKVASRRHQGGIKIGPQTPKAARGCGRRLDDGLSGEAVKNYRSAKTGVLRGF
jgi:hypothetical protein